MNDDACAQSAQVAATFLRKSPMKSSPDITSSSARKLPAARAGFALLAIVQATLIFTIALIMIPLPEISAQFGMNSSQMLFLQVAYGLPFSGLLLFGGRLADRFPERIMFAIGLILFGLASLAAALAPNYQVLASMRFLQGIGGALTAPAAMAILRTIYPSPVQFGRAMATWGGVSILGATLGFVLSGIITAWISWRWMFIAPITVTAAALLLSNTLLPASRPRNHHEKMRLDPVGALLATASIVLISYALIRSSETPWSDLHVWGVLTAGLLLLICFFTLEKKVSSPLLPPHFLLNANRAAGLIGMMMAAAGSVLIELLPSLFLQQIRQWSALTTALSFLPLIIALLVANQFASPIVHRFGARKSMIAGFLIAAAGLCLYAFLHRETDYLLGMVPGQILVSVGIALVFSGSAVLSTSNVPEHQAGLAGGVMNTAMELGPTFGLAVFMSVAGLRVDVVEGYALAFAAGTIIYVLIACWLLFLTDEKADH